ncbi:glycoprotein integral membrane protein 1 isoform X1 [Ornithorhynchus anatinus]|uniref:glycoprotein integral membrane protein 1 isoform X1 n=1 Tax=Ornithorhynchus anatinus TaxID=9258 RepID=UPI00028F349E|nr:glycoprotein integral membrane protein 1 isoform X1 [Ornithorhynchus anatinus]
MPVTICSCCERQFGDQTTAGAMTELNEPTNPVTSRLCYRPCVKLKLCALDNIRINVTLLNNDGELHEKQVVLNVTYDGGQIYVNDFPMKTGVSRIRCQTLIEENGNSGNLPVEGNFGVVSLRILVHVWPMTSKSDVQLIVVQQEVMEIDGKQVQQKDMIEIDILVKEERILRRTNYTVPLQESMLYSIPVGSDIVLTPPNLSRKASDGPLQTTSQYLLRNVETTVDEDTLAVKLPETPLRAESPSSYRVMCRWMEGVREDLRRFWVKAFPVLFKFMNVMLVGIIGAAVIITFLTMFFPGQESKGILRLDKVNAVPIASINPFPNIPEKAKDEKMGVDYDVHCGASLL